jgi:hypothetical protein
LRVSPRQAFQSFFAVALGWVALAFPVFLAVASDSWTAPDGPQVTLALYQHRIALRGAAAVDARGLAGVQVPNLNPLALTPQWAYAITAAWAAALVVGMWGWVNAPRGSKAELPKTVQDKWLAWLNFASLALSGYATGLPTLCAANSAKLFATNTWQVMAGGQAHRSTNQASPAWEH